HTYSGRKNRRYHYYTCGSARQNGSAACPGKSVPAAHIERSILERIEDHNGVGQFRAEWDALGPVEHIEFMRSVVESVMYNGATHRVSIRFRADAVSNSDAQ